jgi:hypothetical protein
MSLVGAIIMPHLEAIRKFPPLLPPATAYSATLSEGV